MTSEAIAEVQTPEALDALIPKPVGYHILICMPQASDTYGESGIIKATTSIQRESILSMVGLVLDMGEQAYSDPERFPNGPWCEQGDWVMFARYAGSRFAIDGGNVSILNDDEILARISEPSDVLHY